MVDSIRCWSGVELWAVCGVVGLAWLLTRRKRQRDLGAREIALRKALLKWSDVSTSESGWDELKETSAFRCR